MENDLIVDAFCVLHRLKNATLEIDAALWYIREERDARRCIEIAAALLKNAELLIANNEHAKTPNAAVANALRNAMNE